MQVATYNSWNTVTNQIQGKSERGREGSLDDDNGILLIFRYCNVKLRAMTIFFSKYYRRLVMLTKCLTFIIFKMISFLPVKRRINLV